MPRKRPTEPPPLRVHSSSDPNLIIEERDKSTWFPKQRGWNRGFDARDRDFLTLEILYGALLGTSETDRATAKKILDQNTSALKAAELCPLLGIDDQDRTLRRRITLIRKEYRIFEAARQAAKQNR